MKFKQCKLLTWYMDYETKRAGRCVYKDPSTERLTLCENLDEDTPPDCWYAFAISLRRLSPLELLALQAPDEHEGMVCEDGEGEVLLATNGKHRHREVVP